MEQEAVERRVGVTKIGLSAERPMLCSLHHRPMDGQAELAWGWFHSQIANLHEICCPTWALRIGD